MDWSVVWWTGKTIRGFSLHSWALWLSARWLLAIAGFLGALGLSQALSDARPAGSVVLEALGLGLTLGGAFLVQGAPALPRRAPGRRRSIPGGASLSESATSSPTPWVAARYPGVLVIATGLGLILGPGARDTNPLWPLGTAGILVALALILESRRR
jgi:hypothetical protein